IAKYLPGRTEVQCLHRWQKVLKPSLVKGPWTAEEDQTVEEHVQMYETCKWSKIADALPRRIEKQCCKRWHNHLNPDISKKAWSVEEDRTILEYHITVGNRRSETAKLLLGRYVALTWQRVEFTTACHSLNAVGLQSRQNQQCNQKSLELVYEA
ncbi:hypothetical protein ACHAW6_002689, partial [Cyclotella cf. meneghiniana]